VCRLAVHKLSTQQVPAATPRPPASVTNRYSVQIAQRDGVGDRGRFDDAFASTAKALAAAGR
jgi:hypothetical protein